MTPNQAPKTFKLSRWKHNDFMPHRKLEWWARAEYTITDQQIVVYKYVNLIGWIALTLTSPLYILKNGWQPVKCFLKEKWSSCVGEYRIKRWNDLYNVVNMSIRMNGGWKQ